MGKAGVVEKVRVDGKSGFAREILPGADEDGVCGARGKEVIAAEEANIEWGRGDCARREGKRREEKAGQHEHDSHV